MNAEELDILNRQGLFPGIEEDEPAFLERVAFLKTATLPAPFAGCERIPKEAWQKAHARTVKLFDIAPEWIPAIYLTKGLRFWEGAAAWELSDLLPLIQLRPYPLPFYAEEEFLAHETVHAVRAHLKQERFEELLAYATSARAYRRWLGPLFQKPWEAALFLFSLLLAVLGTLFFSTESTFLLPIALLLYGGVRLFFLHRTFRRCVQHLAPCLIDPSKALAVTLRLTDAEISLFSRLSPEQILHYIEAGKATSLRLRALSREFTYVIDCKLVK